MRKLKKPGAKRGDVNRVKSGIGLSEFTVRGTDDQGQAGLESAQTDATDDGSAITSRTARVLLAGAGFLADAVSRFVACFAASPFGSSCLTPQLNLHAPTPLISTICLLSTSCCGCFETSIRTTRPLGHSMR